MGALAQVLHAYSHWNFEDPLERLIFGLKYDRAMDAAGY